MGNKYPICNCGKPMISTMAFRGKEFWCWNCGHTDTFFCSVDRSEISEDQLKQLDIKEKQSQEFLDARGCKYGGGMRKIKGELVYFEDLPEDLKVEIEKIADSWNYSRIEGQGS